MLTRQVASSTRVALADLTGSFICFRGSWRREISRALASRESDSTNDGDPIGVERLGIALEPEAEYELVPTVEDAKTHESRLSKSSTVMS